MNYLATGSCSRTMDIFGTDVIFFGMSHRFRTCSVLKPTASCPYANVESFGLRQRYTDMQRVSFSWQSLCRALCAIEDFGPREHVRADRKVATW